MFQKNIYLGDYRVEWADQKISLECECGQETIEIFSDASTVCSSCKRRFSILEIIRIENYPDDLDNDDIDNSNLGTFFDKIDKIEGSTW